MLRFVLAVSCAYALCGSHVSADELSPQQFFDQQVQPILAEHCFKCHGGEAKIRGGLTLTNHQGVLDGGDSGPSFEADDLESSPLLSAINYEDYEMPPSGKLPAEQIATLTKWVRMGAPWSHEQHDFGFEGETEHEAGPPQVNEQSRQFWSYQPVQRPELPAVQQSQWVTNPIDQFVLAKLEDAQLEPNHASSKAKLARRVYYDLTGLSPTPAEVADFVADPATNAYEKLVDRLLDSEAFGQRWARHWLDVVRYAETNSFERDGAKPHIWRYRDWVVDSFNNDKPYDQFVIEQLAGDELPEVTPESYIATGYYRLGQWDDEPTDQLQADFDGLDDIVATTGQVFLGMTVDCARCHDHKIDPIPQADYYRMLAFFRGVRPYGHRRLDEANTPQFDKKTGQRVSAKRIRELKQQRQRLEHLVRQVEKEARKQLTNPEKEDFAFVDNRVKMLRDKQLLPEQKIAEYESALAELSDVRSQHDHLNATTLTAFGVSEFGSQPPQTHIMVRGNAHVEGDAVQPGYPSVLGFEAPDEFAPSPWGTSGRRLALAKWIVDPANPLSARVIVNRLWQHHFGRGIVETSNDFGFQGSRPTHPQLLDWLAAELVSGGWKLKRIHKLMVMSSTYRMSSAGNAAGLTEDAENRLFWRMNMRRLSAEEIRDSLLAANGTLNRAAGGPSVYPKIPAAVLAGQSRPGAGWGKSSPQEAARRSIYIHAKRSLVTPILASFDVANTDTSCPVRFATTQPTQALGMLNSEFLNEQAALFAKRLRKEAGESVADQVRLALQIVTAREPSEQEVQRGQQFIQQLQDQDKATAEAALDQFCLLALNLNEFMYID